MVWIVICKWKSFSSKASITKGLKGTKSVGKWMLKISLHFYQKIRTHSLCIERILLYSFRVGQVIVCLLSSILTKFWLELNFRILFPSKTCQTRCSSKNDLTKNCGYTKSVGRCEDTVCMKGALLNLSSIPSQNNFTVHV